MDTVAAGSNGTTSGWEMHNMFVPWTNTSTFELHTHVGWSGIFTDGDVVTSYMRFKDWDTQGTTDWLSVDCRVVYDFMPANVQHSTSAYCG